MIGVKIERGVREVYVRRVRMAGREGGGRFC